jgi:large repetitive protein
MVFCTFMMKSIYKMALHEKVVIKILRINMLGISRKIIHMLKSRASRYQRPLRRSLLLAGSIMLASLNAYALPPSDESFQAYSGDFATVATPRYLGGFSYLLDGGGTTFIVDSASFGLTATTGNTLVLNADAANNVRNFTLSSTNSSDNFKLVKMSLESFGGTSSVQFTVTGYDNGVAVATDNINITASIPSGSITYVKDSSVDGGVLSFGSDWKDIDSINFTATDGSGLYMAIDTIDISAAVPLPKITSSTYDAFTSTLAVTGTNITNGGTIDVSKLTLTGQGGSTYTLTSSNVTASSATSFSVTLNASDKLSINGLLNKNGSAAVGGTIYNLAAAANWDVTGAAPADVTGNGITVSNVSAPSITSAT